MNYLNVGQNRDTLLDHLFDNLPERFLILDDGPYIDALLHENPFDPNWNVTVFDFEKHKFNPVKDITYKRARDFLSVLDAVFPEGKDTLTKRYSSYALLGALLDGAPRLDKLISDTKDTRDAYLMIQTILYSPVLKRVLNGSGPKQLSFNSTILVRLNRAELGDFDCFVLGNLLISQYEGTVVIPDFGFYAHPGHRSLIRQDRLIAGITSFDEVPQLRNDLIQIANKKGSRCTPKDAELLASYSRVRPDPLREDSPYTRFIQDAIS